MEESIFTKIIKGDIPAHRIYEDEDTIAILTINPIRPGHVLVIPKKQIDHLWDLDEDDYQAVMMTVRKVGRRIREVLQPVRVGVHVAGIEVPHAHVHLFPFNNNAEFWQQPSGEAANDADLAAMAEKLKMEGTL